MHLFLQNTSSESYVSAEMAEVTCREARAELCSTSPIPLKEKQAVVQQSEGMEKVLLGSPIFDEWYCIV